jgi:predicted RNase H-like HicB family nuclease
MNIDRFETRMFINDRNYVFHMKKKFNIIIEKDEEGWYVSEVVELPGCHTQAKSIDELMERTKEAIRAYLEGDEEQEFSTFVEVKQIEV